MTGTEAGGATGEREADPFAFGAEDVRLQAARNLMVLVTLPWAAAFAVAAEFAALATGRRD